MTVSTSGRIEITRTIDAPRDLVFSAWITPEHFTHWFGAPLDTITMDVRPGGEWRATIVVDEETQVPFTGVYREIVPSERLVLTLEDLSGKEAAPGQAGVEVVTVTFNEVGGQTEMRFAQVGTLPDEELPRAEEGWGHFFDALETHLATVK
ncbi:SRPBCC family protein [Streptosporangium sp. KLBMP 9127]|nr:SRPBCC domain-containing protein [Streptosporangium sp. KLBMP 9127]